MSTEKYEKIINLPHHVSGSRARMPIRDRAAQFAPFAALTGYDSMVEETARLTDSEDAYSEEGSLLLDRKLRVLGEHEDEHPYVEITYFIPDQRKSGGRYDTAYGYLKLIDRLEGALILMDKRKILFERIRELNSTAFNEISFE